jgi:hypothetical protein
MCCFVAPSYTPARARHLFHADEGGVPTCTLGLQQRDRGRRCRRYGGGDQRAVEKGEIHECVEELMRVVATYKSGMASFKEFMKAL